MTFVLSSELAERVVKWISFGIKIAKGSDFDKFFSNIEEACNVIDDADLKKTGIEVILGFDKHFNLQF